MSGTVTMNSAFSTLGALAGLAEHADSIVDAVAKTAADVKSGDVAGAVAEGVAAVETVATATASSNSSTAQAALAIAAAAAPVAEQIADAIPTSNDLRNIADAAKEAGPFIAEVATTVAFAETGNVLGAVATGLKAAHDGVELAQKVGPAVQSIAHEIGNAAESVVDAVSSTAHSVAHAAAHVVSGGVVSMIEDKLGGLPAEMKAKLNTLVHGFVHAATLFHIA